MGFTLTAPQVFGGQTAILLGVKDFFDWVDDKKGSRAGTSYAVLALGGGDPQVLQVKVPDDKAVITSAELETYVKAHKFIEISFDGFVAKTYNDKAGQTQLSCKATVATIDVPLDL